MISSKDGIAPYPEKLMYHCVWFGSLLKHHVLSIASLFATQLNPSVIVWTDVASLVGMQALVKLFDGKDIKLRVGDDWIREHLGAQGVQFRSDAWRLQILQKHGGVYFDLDILFLKDVSWFANSGTAIVQEGYAAERAFNNALMYFPRDHLGISSWVRRVYERPTLGWRTVFEDQAYSYLTVIGARIISNRETDIGWVVGAGPGFDDFFEEAGLSPDYLSESITYHWHNRWNKPVDTPGTLVAHYWNMWAAPYWQKHIAPQSK